MGIPTSHGLLVFWTLSLTLVKQIRAEGTFELDIIKFTNDIGYNAEGNCCNGVLYNGYCTSPCRTFFRICLKEYQANISPNPPCTFGSLTTPYLGENSFNITDNTHVAFSNPIRLDFSFAWPGYFSLIVEAFHDTTMTGPVQDSPRELISRLATQRSGEVSQTWTHDVFHDSYHIQLEYRYRIICADSYYGPTCNDVCIARDDQFGHYTCGENGIVCMPGWEETYCDKPICPPGCHPENGHCETPNECKCSIGWQGTNCDECIPYPGCSSANGYCTDPWTCDCHEGWAGQFCNQDLNFCTNKKPCHGNATCHNTGEGSYTCICPPGWTGTNCEIRINSCEHSPCLNGGTCMEEGNGYECRCTEEFKGPHCELRIGLSCAENPCSNGGTCVPTYDGASYRCDCHRGYTGEYCESEVNECESNPCVHGSCVDEDGGFLCVCEIGYTGTTCNDNENNCNPNPCLHGGSCIDKVNDFECRCVAGYVGKVCETDVDDCAIHPCANGGTCHDQLNDFVCQCAPGFGGKDCRVNIDECQAEPCQNGGTCIDRVADFECLCVDGYHGNTCALVDGQTPLNTVASETTKDPLSDHSSPSTSLTSTTPPPSRTAQVIVKDGSIVSMQITLIVTLGVGLPCILIIIVLAFLLWRRRRNSHRHAHAHQHAHDPHKDNERNSDIANSMNNRSHSSNIRNNKLQTDSFVPLSSSSNTTQTHLKLTNEELYVEQQPSSRTIKDCNLRNNLHTDSSSSSRNKLYKKDNVMQLGQSKDYQDTRESSSHHNVLDPNQLRVHHLPSASQLSIDPAVHGYDGGGSGSSHQHHKPYQSDIYILDKPHATQYASEAVLATEV